MAKKHRVLFIDAGSGKGGSSVFLHNVLKYVDKEKFQPSAAFYFFNDGPDTGMIRELGIPVFFLADEREPSEYVPVRWLLGKSELKVLHYAKVILRLLLRMVIVDGPMIYRLTRLIRREAINLVVLNNDVHYHIVGTLGARIAGVPCICRKAGGIGEGKKIKRLLTPLINLFISISQATTEDQYRIIPSTKRLVKIYEGVDLRVFNAQAEGKNVKKELNMPGTTRVVANISRFDLGKGQSEFLDAAALIIKEYPEVVFLMVGDGELMNDLKAKTAKLNLTDHVFFAGWRRDIAEILSVVDVFVHCPTTWIEGLGIATLEAAAMGKPSVVSANGGLPDVVLDGISGFVVPPGNIEKLSDAILRLLSNEELAKEFGKNARKRAEAEFDIEKNVKKLEALFEECVASPRL